jgi:hypothetical protein
MPTDYAIDAASGLVQTFLIWFAFGVLVLIGLAVGLTRRRDKQRAAEAAELMRRRELVLEAIASGQRPRAYQLDRPGGAPYDDAA